MNSHIMNRMKLIITALLCAVSSCLFGQTDNKQLDKLEKPWMEYNKALIQKLTSDISRLQHELDSLRWMRQQRHLLLNSGSADSSATQQKKKVSSQSKIPYVSVADLARRKDWAKDDLLKDTYNDLVAMYESVDSVKGKYEPGKNALLKKKIPGIRKAIQGLNPDFKESFEELANQIESFQYAWLELEKARERVKKLNFESVPEYIAELDKNYEIEFVKMIPYTLHQLNKCIEAKVKFVNDNNKQKKRAEEERQQRLQGNGRENKSGDGTLNDGSENNKM